MSCRETRSAKCRRTHCAPPMRSSIVRAGSGEVERNETVPYRCVSAGRGICSGQLFDEVNRGNSPCRHSSRSFLAAAATAAIACTPLAPAWAGPHGFGHGHGYGHGYGHGWGVGYGLFGAAVALVTLPIAIASAAVNAGAQAIAGGGDYPHAAGLCAARHGRLRAAARVLPGADRPITLRPRRTMRRLPRITRERRRTMRRRACTTRRIRVTAMAAMAAPATVDAAAIPPDITCISDK